MFVKADKCEFHVSSGSFLGFIIEKRHLKPDPAKIKAVLEWSSPNTPKQLQRFLGFANFYRRIFKNYGQYAAPLMQLTSVTKPFVWSSVVETAFSKLMEMFSSAKSPQIPTFSLWWRSMPRTWESGLFFHSGQFWIRDCPPVNISLDA